MNASDVQAMSDEVVKREIAVRRGWGELFVNSTQMRGVDAGILCGKPPQGLTRSVPNWPQDVNAAMELLKDMPHHVLWWSEEKHWVVSYMAEPSQYTHADTPARAICEAWLLWKMAVDNV